MYLLLNNSSKSKFLEQTDLKFKGLLEHASYIFSLGCTCI